MAAWLRLVRPFNLIILAAAILLGRYLAGSGGGPGDTAAALLGAILLVAGFYVWNDVADREVDRTNRPGRPIPSGAVPVRAARVLAAALFTAAFAFAAAAGLFYLGAAAVWFVLLVLYERVLKRTGFAGNVLVSAVASSSLLYGARLGGSIAAGVPPALFAFLIHLGREIVKDVADVGGDREGGRRTLPMAVGDRGALVGAAVPLALLVLLTPVPFLIGMYDLVYLLIVVAGVDLLLAWGLYRCFTRPDRPNFEFLARMLKGQMVIGMVAMLLGRNA